MPDIQVADLQSSDTFTFVAPRLADSDRPFCLLAVLGWTCFVAFGELRTLEGWHESAEGHTCLTDTEAGSDILLPGVLYKFASILTSQRGQ